MENLAIIEIRYNYISIIVIISIFTCYFYNYMSIIRGIPKLNTVFKGETTMSPQSNLQLFSTAGLAFYGQAGLFFGDNAIQQKYIKKGE